MTTIEIAEDKRTLSVTIKAQVDGNPFFLIGVLNMLFTKDMPHACARFDGHVFKIQLETNNLANAKYLRKLVVEEHFKAVANPSNN